MLFCDFLLIMHSFISGACVLLCDSFLLLDKGRGLPETGRIKCYCCCCTMEFLLAAMYWLVKLYLKKPLISVLHVLLLYRNQVIASKYIK